MKNAMPIDFHSHFPVRNAMLCTAMPLDCEALVSLEGLVLMHFEGLLPQYWNNERFEALKRILIGRPSINLGEVGIDRRFATQRPLSQQFKDLIEVLSYARSLGKKATIHSVHATEATINALKEASMPCGSVLWHGFSGSKETAMQLRRLGVLIGIGPHFRGDLKSIVAANPAWVLETDYEGTDENQYNGILTAHYRSVAQGLGMSVEEVKEHCRGQAEAFADKQISW